jgi:hypothetical protein
MHTVRYEKVDDVLYRRRHWHQLPIVIKNLMKDGREQCNRATDSPLSGDLGLIRTSVRSDQPHVCGEAFLSHRLLVTTSLKRHLAWGIPPLCAEIGDIVGHLIFDLDANEGQMQAEKRNNLIDF